MKDTANLLNHSQWSAGDYDNTNIYNTLNTIRTTNAFYTNEYSGIGEYSIKMIKQAATGAYCRVKYNNSIHNKTVVTSAAIKTNNYNSQLILLEIKNDTIIQQETVVIPANTEGIFTVSLVAGNDNDSFIIQFNNLGPIDSFIHVDDVCLI